MKGLILSGGKGTRLRPLTYTSAKQLIPIANKPILFYGIEFMREAGIKEIGIVVGDTAEEIRAACGDGSQFGVRITYLPQDAPRGLAHAASISRDFMAGEPFCMYLGDNLLRDGIAGIVRDYQAQTPDCMILLTRVPDPERFGVAELNPDGSVKQLVEKPKEPKSDLALVGVYLFNDSIFEACAAIQPSARGELEITDAIQWLVEHGRTVRPSLVQGWWKDTGKKSDLLDANRLVLERQERAIRGGVDDPHSIIGEVVIEAGARVTGSTIRGPVIVGAGAVIEDAFIGPFTSVGPNAVVRNCEVEHSILLEGATVADIGTRLEDSVVGRGAVVRLSHERPRAVRLMVGDNSE
ncbi:MAG TPA: glucose-1-phosphate thymidylyltransferase, partial [bacterium]|nr:glucose-1-phosphate thymidylyltransferase [bacterium]